jgi:hypothetical protein
VLPCIHCATAMKEANSDGHLYLYFLFPNAIVFLEVVLEFLDGDAPSSEAKGLDFLTTSSPRS